MPGVMTIGFALAAAVPTKAQAPDSDLARIRTALNHLAVLTMLLAASVSTGCATIAHGSKQDVMVLSDPTAANVFIGSKQVGVTPVRLTLKRRNRTVLRFEKDGFEATEIPLKRGADGWLTADLLLPLNPLARQGLDSADDWPKMAATGIAQLLTIDWLTGAAYKLPKSVTAVLPPRLRPAPDDRSLLRARSSLDRPR